MVFKETRKPIYILSTLVNKIFHQKLSKSPILVTLDSLSFKLNYFQFMASEATEASISCPRPFPPSKTSISTAKKQFCTNKICSGFLLRDLKQIFSLFKFRPCWAAAIAPWYHLRLPSCGCGFKSQAHHLHFFQFVLVKLYQENNENKQKEAGIVQSTCFTLKMALLLFFENSSDLFWLNRVHYFRIE